MSAHREQKPEIWVFGYGSLIWRPGFEYPERRQAVLNNFQRSFCQASHDHRGTPEQPGRVVTLEACHGAQCQGVAFRLSEPSTGVLDALDIREQDGYARTAVQLELEDGRQLTGVTWIARPDNPSWRGGESLGRIAQIIASSEGPSGSNRDYLFELHKALQTLGIDDENVSRLSQRVRGLLN